MKCTAVHKYLTEGWEPSGNLDPKVQEHLGVCLQCRTEKEQIANAFQLLNGLRQMAPTADFSTAWRRRIREEAAKEAAAPGKMSLFKSAWLKPACSFAFLIIVAVAFFGYQHSLQAPKPQTPEIALKKSVIPQEEVTTLRSAAVESAADHVLYDLKVMEVGPKNREVQRVIRNFRSSHEEGIVFSNKIENEEWTTFKELSPEKADLLRQELENLGAKVELTPSSNP